VLEVAGQEGLARSLGDGHRLLRGVAGSGKTVALIARARHLHATYPDWRILVLCFNRVLADFLRQAIGDDDRLEISTFHAWCHRELRRAHIRLPPLPEQGRAWQEYWERVPALLLETYARDRARATYQAVLVDEGQDFADDWYRVILHALDPISNSLLIALDPSQNIYKRTISWRDIGVQAQGRSHVLRINYRNTRPILTAAYRVISSLDARAAAAALAEATPIVPDEALRGGPPPEIRRHASGDASRLFALDWIRGRLARGIAPEAVLVLGLSKPEVASFQAWLKDNGVRTAFVAAAASPASVRLSTIHGAKGLDAGHVLLIGAHELEQRDEEEGRRLLYIAMTRARDELGICYHAKSRLMAELEAVIAGLRSTPRP
jgi:superfamily I DNA/RNA helicase